MKRRDLTKLLGTTALLNSFPLMANEENHKKKLKKNLVLISTNYGFDPNRFMPKNDTLNSEYFKYYQKIKPKMTVFKGIEQAEMGGGHRSHHSIFTAQSKYNKITKPFVSLDQLIASRGIQETRHKFLSFSTGKSSQTCWSLSGQYIPPYSTYEAAFNGIFKDQVETKTLLEQKQFFSHFQASSLANSKSDNYLRAMHELVQEIDTTIHWSQDKLPKTNTKYQFSKNEFMNIEGYLDKKLKILAVFESEMGIFPFPRSPKAIKSLAYLRGVQANCEAAEAFMLMKGLTIEEYKHLNNEELWKNML